MKSATPWLQCFHAVAMVSAVCLFASPFLTAAGGLTHSAEPPIGQAEDTQNVETGNEPDRSERPLIRLPARMPDGRRFSPIALFQSQMAELIPAHFRPVTIDALNEAVAGAETRVNNERSSRLRSSLYVVELVDDTLISNRSVLDIESQPDAVVRLSLGKVNLAIDRSQKPSTTSALNTVPRIESDDRGNLVAVVNGDSAIQFGWSLRGQSSGASREFDLHIPRSPQTRIVLAAPGNVVIESLAGVLRDSPSPPPEIDDGSPKGDIRYYIIDAGGLQSIELRTRPLAQASEAGAMVVRWSETRYEVDPSGMTWTTQMTVQTPVGSRLPPLDVSHGTVTSVSVDSVGTDFTTSLLDGSARRIRIDAPIKSFQAAPSFDARLRQTSAAGLQPDPTGAEGEIASESLQDREDAPKAWREYLAELFASTELTTVTVTGQLLWDGASGWCELPTLLWRGNRVIFAESTSQVELVVDNRLQVVSWQLPETWGTPAEDVSGDATRIITATGPPIVQSGVSVPWESSPTAEPSEGDSSLVPWSRVRLKTQAALHSNRAALKLNVGDGSLDARARMEIEIDPAVVEPVRLYVQPGWTLLSVSLPASGRVIETPNVDAKSMSMMLWPEPSDAPSDVLVIEATGVSRSAEGGNGALASTWFLRPDGVRTDLVAAVVPPPGLNWGGETALLGDRVELPQLTPSQQAFFSDISDETLIFNPPTGRTPLISLQPPGITFGVTTTLYLRREGQDVVENLVIETNSLNQLLKQLSIRTGPALGRPNLTWILQTAAEAAPISLPPSDVRLDNENTDGQYTVDLSERTLRDRRLVGRRRYSLDGPLQFRLPTVPGATSQNSEVLLGPGLRLVQKSPSVLRVPADNDASIHTTANEDSTTAGGMSTRDQAQPAGMTSAAIGTPALRLRYDAVDQPLITIDKSDVNANPTIVWQQDIRVIASSRGTDRVEATFEVSAAEPIEIDYDPDLQLSAIYRNAIPIDLLTIPRRLPIVLQPASQRETIRIVWNRDQFGSYWFRRCRIPTITASGVVVSSEYRLVASADTFAPAALWRGSLGESQTSSSSLPMSAGNHATLIRRNTALGAGWLLAAIVFAISWHVSRRSPLAVAVFVIASVTTALLWWPWHVVIVGWVIVPSVAAGLLATSLAWQANGSRIGARSRSSLETDNPESVSSDADDSQGFSLATPLLLSALISWAVASGVRAQDIDSRTAPSAINVLVPVDGSGRPLGDKVYIPESVHAELFRVEASELPQPARFLLADYRVQLQLGRDDSDKNRPRVEAEYLVHVDRPTNRVRLPLPPTSVRRIELIQAEQDRIVQVVADSEDSVVVTLPKSDTFRLRLTLIPTLSSSSDELQLQLAIPPIASSRLTVETDRAIHAVKIAGAGGMITEESDLRRWVADLGPINELKIAYQTADRPTDLDAKPLVRRYWVHVAKSGTAVDCEVEPMTAIERGGTVQLVVRDSMIPTVVSSLWRLQRSELVSPSRRLITLENLSDTSTPIRLMWSSPLAAGIGDSTVESSVMIPEVIAPASGPNSAAWIAVDSDPSLRVRPISADPLESLAVDQFLAAWGGYRGPIDRAFVAINELPTLGVTRLRSNPSVQQQHQVHVMPDELQLQYSATLTESDAKRHTLRYPVGVELRRLSVNGQAVNNQPVQSDQFNEVALPSMNTGDPVKIELTAIASLPQSRRFSLPRFQLWPRVETTDRFSLSRDQTSNVRTLKPVPIAREQVQPVASAEALAEGRIPIATWTLDAATDPDGLGLSKGVFRVTPNQVSFKSHQLIVLSWDQGRWDMETLIRFDGSQVPDFVDVQIPTRWCDSLEVTPATAWSRQPAIDPSFQVIRIRCDADALRDRPLAIRGQLVTTDKGRVSVPPVAVLGRGSRKIEISVPNRLAAEPIQWRFSSVRGIELPTLWENDLASTQSRSTYTVGNPAWSIELAPLRQLEFESVAVSSDAQVFSRSDGTLVLCRWDLVPSGLNTVAVRLPRNAVCLGAWTAERAVEIESPVEPDSNTSGNDTDPDAGNLIQLPLALSRLSQSVEVLLRVPIASAKQADYLPELVDIPVIQQWVAIYEPIDTANARTLSKQVENEGITVRHPVALQSERAFALARALTDAVDYSLDTSVEQPASEIATWLAPWIARYQQIAESAGHHVNWDSSLVDESWNRGDAVATRVSDGANILAGQPWHALDARMGEHIRRFFPVQPPQVTPLFGDSHFDGFVLTRVTRVSSHNRLPSVQPASASAQDLQFMLMNVLTLGMVCGALCLFWPLRHYAHPVVVHPAFWLGLAGIFGFFVAPAPVAAAVVLVAVSLPAFPRPTIRVKKSRLNG